MFDVDIADGAPTLKLPYNLDEDVWTSSQEFLRVNQLNPVYLEEVVAFVQARIAESGRKSTAAVPTSSYQDPFTGLWAGLDWRISGRSLVPVLENLPVLTCQMFVGAL